MKSNEYANVENAQRANYNYKSTPFLFSFLYTL